jgi:hypothetical protein
LTLFVKAIILLILVAWKGLEGLSIEQLIARIAYVLEELDRIPAETKAESPLIQELEFLLDQYKDYKKVQRYQTSLLERLEYFENDKKRATME